MKYIILILIVLGICACDKPIDNNDDKEQEPTLVTKEELLKKEAIRIYSQYEINEENLGSKMTPLRSILPGLVNGILFNNCDTENTRIVYSIKKDADGTYYSIGNLVFDCDGKTITYFYDGLFEGEPTYIHESNKGE